MAISFSAMDLFMEPIGSIAHPRFDDGDLTVFLDHAGRRGVFSKSKRYPVVPPSIISQNIRPVDTLIKSNPLFLVYEPQKEEILLQQVIYMVADSSSVRMEIPSGWSLHTAIDDSTFLIQNEARYREYAILRPLSNDDDRVLLLKEPGPDYWKEDLRTQVHIESDQVLVLIDRNFSRKGVHIYRFKISTKEIKYLLIS